MKEHCTIKELSDSEKPYEKFLRYDIGVHRGRRLDALAEGNHGRFFVEGDCLDNVMAAFPAFLTGAALSLAWDALSNFSAPSISFPQPTHITASSGLKGDIKQAKRKRGKMLLYARRTRKSGEIKLNIYKVSYSLC